MCNFLKSNFHHKNNPQFAFFIKVMKYVATVVANKADIHSELYVLRLKKFDENCGVHSRKKKSTVKCTFLHMVCLNHNV